MAGVVPNMGVRNWRACMLPHFSDILRERDLHVPVGIRQFVEDPDYLGPSIGESGVYPDSCFE